MNRKLLLLCTVVQLLGYKSIEGMQEEMLYGYMEVFSEPTSRFFGLPADVRNFCIFPYLINVVCIEILDDATPLHVAARLGSESLVSLLLAQGVDVDIRSNKVGMTPLMVASYYGHDAVVEKILSQGANANHSDKFGYTALQFAAENGFCSIVEKLLTKDADANLADKYGYTPLLKAIEKNHVSVVETLLAARADTSEKAPLPRAARQGKDVLVEKLLLAGAQVDTPLHGKTALHLAAENGHSGVVEQLLAAGASVDTSLRGKTALHFAAENGRSSVVEGLLTAGADKDASDTSGLTVLHTAVGHLAVVEKLLAVQVAINARNDFGQTSLSRAAELGCPGTVRVLLEAGADKGIADRWGKLPLDYALDKLRFSGDKKWYDVAKLLGVDEAQLPLFAI